MQIYDMPPDTREKEKIVGGIFDLFQLAWIAAGAVLYALQAMILFRILGYLCLITGLIFIIWGFVFALKKKDGLPYPTYLRLRFRHRHKTRYYINSGYHRKLEFSGIRPGKEELDWNRS